MVTIGFHDIEFKQNPQDETLLRAFFYKRFYFDIPKEEINNLGEWKIVEGDLEIDCAEKKAENKLTRLIEQGMNNLTHLLYNKPAVYISEESGLALIGSNEFGVIDRGSNILEVKPVTGCNFNCVYCSVDEGKNDKTHDYFVECEYLIDTVKWVAARKEHPVECNIGPQGEPLIYPKILELIKGLMELPNVAVTSINTNGSLLSKPLVDKLAEAKLTRINLSLNAVEQEAANKLAGTAYPLDRVIEMIGYAQEKGIAVLLAPTLVPGYNEDQMEGLVQISKTIKSDFPSIGIQNFLKYKKGRNPSKEWKWEKFYGFIEDLEKKTEKSLKSSMEDFGIYQEEELPKPWKKNQTVRAKIMIPGRYPKEVVAVAGEGQEARCITIINAPNQKIGRDVKVKIIRDKHNIYKGTI